MQQPKQQRGRRKNNYGLRQDERGIWHCDFSVAGKRFQRSTATHDKAQAQEWCAQIADRAWRERKLGEAPSVKWEEAIAAWCKAKATDAKKNLANDVDKARLLAPHFDGKYIHELTSALVNSVLDQLQSDRGFGGSTRNRYRAFIVGVVNFCKARGWNVPAALAVEKREEPSERVRWITREEADRLLMQLPVHLRRMVEFSLATGLRQSNVTGLRWSKVDTFRRIAWVESEDAKARKSIPVPLNNTAIRILNEARTCSDHGSEFLVFTYFGRSVQQPANSAFLKALGRAGIENFRWHDLRHTWATWHVMAGTPLPVLQKLGGWSDIRMVMKYAHVSPDFAAQFANNVDPFKSSVEVKVREEAA